MRFTVIRQACACCGRRGIVGALPCRLCGRPVCPLCAKSFDEEPGYYCPTCVELLENYRLGNLQISDLDYVDEDDPFWCELAAEIQAHESKGDNARSA